MQETKMNSVIKFLSKKMLAEDPGPKRQVLCELLVEELDRVMIKPEINTQKNDPTATLNKGKDKQPEVVEENEIITRTPQPYPGSLSEEDNDPKEESSGSNQYQTNLIVERVQIEANFNPFKKWEPITFLNHKGQQL